MITVKFTAILAIAAMLTLSPFMTMTTALAVKSDVGGDDGGGSGIHSNDNNIKHFDGGNDKQITHSVTKDGNNNNIDKHFNNNKNNNNFNNFERHNDFYNFKHNDFKNNNHPDFRFKQQHNNENFFRFNQNDNNHHNDNVKVIHKTVIVHDRDNNQRTIVFNSNLQGTCFVTQSQAANVDNLVAQLLDQCVSVTIIQG
jgi:hypothetical protein